MPIEIQGIKFDTVEEVNKAYDAGIIQKNDPASSTPTTVPAFGAWGSGDTQGGVLSIPGIRPELYSALMRPHSLMAQTNGIKRSDIRTEKIGIITGQTDGSGSNPADFCSASPAVAGQLKRCVQWYNWGKVYMKTRLSALPEEGERIDYADVKKRIQNMARVNNPFVPDIMQNIDIESPAGVLLGTELFNLAIEMDRNFAKVEITGDNTQSNSNTERGFIKEFDGLAKQIVEGRVDKDTNLSCPAADSTVINFSGNIDGTSSIDGRDIVETITDEVWGKQDLADRVQMGGTQFAFLGKKQFFRALTYVWACNYATSRCNGTEGNPRWVNSVEIRRLQLEMLNNQYLLVDNIPYPFLFSDGIPNVRAGGNVYTTDLYFVPLDWMGQRLLHFDYKPMDNQDIRGFTNLAGLKVFESLNNGMYLVGNQHQGMCLEWLFASKFRMIQDAPFLGFVLNNIQYTFRAESFREALPSDTILYKDGGPTYYSIPR